MQAFPPILPYCIDLPWNLYETYMKLIQQYFTWLYMKHLPWYLYETYVKPIWNLYNNTLFYYIWNIYHETYIKPMGNLYDTYTTIVISQIPDLSHSQIYGLILRLDS